MGSVEVQSGNAIALSYAGFLRRRNLHIGHNVRVTALLTTTVDSSCGIAIRHTVRDGGIGVQSGRIQYAVDLAVTTT